MTERRLGEMAWVTLATWLEDSAMRQATRVMRSADGETSAASNAMLQQSHAIVTLSAPRVTVTHQARESEFAPQRRDNKQRPIAMRPNVIATPQRATARRRDGIGPRRKLIEALALRNEAAQIWIDASR